MAFSRAPTYDPSVTGNIMSLRTPRIVLRAWRDEDFAPFAAMNADPRVMEHFPGVLTREQSDALATRIRTSLAGKGFGLWAVDVPGTTDFAGFIGLSVPSLNVPFTPCVEIAWRIAYEHWDKGIATEGARAALDAAFGELALSEVVSFTVPGNTRSRRVMERLGMRHDPRDDFDHPAFEEGDPLRRHVLYRIRTR
jgi:RimJ/RimL family protein N-acetyltransferase